MIPAILLSAVIQLDRPGCELDATEMSRDDDLAVDFATFFFGRTADLAPMKSPNEPGEGSGSPS